MSSKRTEVITAWAQIGLSALFIVGFFALAILHGLGLMPNPVNLNEALMLILAFWFLRQRGEKPQEVKNEGP